MGLCDFNSNLSQGRVGMEKSDAAAQTCRKYAYDESCKKTKSGKVLTPELRETYKGAYDGLFAAYLKHEKMSAPKKK